MSKKKPIEFQPIEQGNQGYIALQIYPPGAWFDSKMFLVFVGGCGRSEHRTLSAAEKALHKLALEECDERIARARSQIEHYENERLKLIGGLKRNKKHNGR